MLCQPWPPTHDGTTRKRPLHPIHCQPAKRSHLRRCRGHGRVDIALAVEASQAQHLEGVSGGRRRQCRQQRRPPARAFLLDIVNKWSISRLGKLGHVTNLRLPLIRTTRRVSPVRRDSNNGVVGHAFATGSARPRRAAESGGPFTSRSSHASLQTYRPRMMSSTGSAAAASRKSAERSRG